MSPRTKEWLWFAALWLGGVSAALSLGYGIKFAMRILGLME